MKASYLMRHAGVPILFESVVKPAMYKALISIKAEATKTSKELHISYDEALAKILDELISELGASNAK